MNCAIHFAAGVIIGNLIAFKLHSSMLSDADFGWLRSVENQMMCHQATTRQAMELANMPTAKYTIHMLCYDFVVIL